MLRVPFGFNPVAGLGWLSDTSNLKSCSASKASLNPILLQLRYRIDYSCSRKYLLFSCKASLGHPSSRSWDREEDDYLEAFVLASETARHYQLHRQGFLEEMKRQPSSQLLPFSLQAKDSNSSVSSIGYGFLSQFHDPTIFLKIACDGDVLLPIIVGDFAIEKLIDAFRGGGGGECPDQFELVRELVGTLGFEVKLVRIVERVVNTYIASIYCGKPGGEVIMSIDARPSDAINVAIRCKAPIFVRKQIVTTDAIKIVYGKWRANEAKSIYDVSLDSAPEEPDSLAEELGLLTKMHIAMKEERFNDAAIWREKLTKLRRRRQDY